MNDCLSNAPLIAALIHDAAEALREDNERAELIAKAQDQYRLPRSDDKSICRCNGKGRYHAIDVYDGSVCLTACKCARGTSQAEWPGK